MAIKRIIGQDGLPYLINSPDETGDEQYADWSAPGLLPASYSGQPDAQDHIRMMPFSDIHNYEDEQLPARLYARLPAQNSSLLPLDTASSSDYMPSPVPVKGLLLRAMAANDESGASVPAAQTDDLDRWSYNPMHEREEDASEDQAVMRGKMGLLNRFSYPDSRDRDSNVNDSNEPQDDSPENHKSRYQNNFMNIYFKNDQLANGDGKTRLFKDESWQQATYRPSINMKHAITSDIDAWSNQAMGFGESPNSPTSAIRLVTASQADNISSIIGKSDPREIGNFMQANTLDSSRILAGKTYMIPQNSRINGDTHKIGQRALDIDNIRRLSSDRPNISQQDLSTSEIAYLSKMLNQDILGNRNLIPKDAPLMRTGGLQTSPFGGTPHYGAIDVRGGDESLRSIQRVPKEIPTNHLQPGETIQGNVFFGGAGMDGPYIQDMVRAFDQHGIKLTPANRDTWSYGTLIDAGPGVQAYRYGRHPFPTPLEKFDQSGSQFNLIGYSYGSEVATQVAVNYARAGTKVDNLVLIGSPISDDFLKTVKNTKNINNVIVLDLEKQGDPIKAGIPLTSLVAGAPTLIKQMLAGTGEGHFYYAPDSDAGKERRNALAEYLYKQGVR
ncbi:hypothetical protein [Undibacterium umbellatum]|uniref:Uncharacterized protein n=1 Tax=Undibacterium umbellatum TaxID=2762300 RepID=A0ABR6Z8H1_9BURK|nr:hypothetical protein [Undibacterium umbellatum]MBC3908052.1 hypothetical protein [Undibacterium umbellatum]